MQIQINKAQDDILDPSTPQALKEAINRVLPVWKEYPALIRKTGAYLKKGERQLYKVTLHKGKSPSEYKWLDWEGYVNDTVKVQIIKALKETDTGYPNRTKRLRAIGEVAEASRRMLELDYEIRGAKGNKKELLQSQIGKADWARNEALDILESLGGRRLRLDAMELSRVFTDSGVSGEVIYRTLARILDGQRDASMLLLKAGISGNRYPTGTRSGMRGKGTYNYVVFDPNIITIERRETLEQRLGSVAGRTTFIEDGRAIMEAFKNKNRSTGLHELYHVWERGMPEDWKVYHIVLSTMFVRMKLTNSKITHLILFIIRNFFRIPHV